MHIPLWLVLAMIAMLFWGVTGVTQKLSTNAISAELSFLWQSFDRGPPASSISAPHHCPGHCIPERVTVGGNHSSRRGCGPAIAIEAPLKADKTGCTALSLPCFCRPHTQGRF
jgi:hypothetical protein